MNIRVPFVKVTAIAFLFAGGSIAPANDASQEAAWTAWKKGNVKEATELAVHVEADAQRNDLLFRCSLVAGQYELALQHHAKIPSSYDRYHELYGAAIDCYLHLARYDEAVEFARRHKVGPIDALQMRADRPFKASLDRVTTISFAEHELTEYFPAFRAELEGQLVTLHIDTGASYISMHPNHAQALGIRLIDYGQGFHAHMKVKLRFGVAKKFKLGDAILENIPVIAFPTCTHMNFGTNVLQQFLSTMDYPRDRLILSPLGSAELRSKHMALLPETRVKLPFYMWGDHYMFARGFLADDEQVTFFMDSGLVALRKINDDPTVQAGFTSSRERFRKWGFSEQQLDQGIFQSHRPIGLGPLRQAGIWFLSGPTGEHHGKNIFGGVQMHGCLAHAFVKKYAWTLDFENRMYTFSSDATSISK